MGYIPIYYAKTDIGFSAESKIYNNATKVWLECALQCGLITQNIYQNGFPISDDVNHERNKAIDNYMNFVTDIYTRIVSNRITKFFKKYC